MTTTPAMPRIDTLRDLKVFLANSPLLKYPSYFFSPAAMSYFDSMTYGAVYRAKDGNGDHSYRGFFVTSERFDESTPREYRVREARIELDEESGTYVHSVDTVGEAVTTLDEARRLARTAAKGL